MVFFWFFIVYNIFFYLFILLLSYLCVLMTLVYQPITFVMRIAVTPKIRRRMTIEPKIESKSNSITQTDGTTNLNNKCDFSAFFDTSGFLWSQLQILFSLYHTI